MVSMGMATGFSFTFNARADVVGQGCDVLTKKTCDVDGNWSLKMQLQKRHMNARIYMNLFSDHQERFDIIVTTKTPGYPVCYDYQTIGSEGLVSWQYCCCLHRDYINCNTIWEIHSTNGVEDDHLFTISFEQCVNNEAQIFAEKWIPTDGISDGSTIVSNCDIFYNNKPPKKHSTIMKPTKPVRIISLRKKFPTKKSKK